MRSLLPNEWLVPPQEVGSYRWVAMGNNWSIVYDTANKCMLFSYNRQVTKWTSTRLLNMHVRLLMMADSNERFLNSLSESQRAFIGPC